MRPGYDYIGVGVGAMVFNPAGRVFLAQRGPRATNERGCWEYPGGKVGFGETLVEAITREMREEYDLTISVIELLGVFDHILPEEQQHWVSATFIARHTDGIPQIIEPEKCTGIGWFLLAALPEPLSRITLLNQSSYHAKYGLRSTW